jgi:hypothetical protein
MHLKKLKLQEEIDGARKLQPDDQGRSFSWQHGKKNK